MSIFRITSLIVVLMGVLDFKSCPSSVEKAGVTETQVIDLADKLKNESSNPLEYAEKISKIAKIAENVNSIVSDGSNKEEVVSEAIKKVEVLADSSDVIKDNLPKITEVIENVADSVSSGLPKEDVVVAPQEQSQTEIQIPQVPTEGIVVVKVPAQVEPVIVNPPVEIEPIQEEEDLDEYDDEEIEEEAEEGEEEIEDEEELTPDEMVEKAFSNAKAEKNIALQAFEKVKSARQKLQDLILGNNITSSDNINSLLEIITNAIQEHKDARIELSSIVSDLDEYMYEKFNVGEANEYDGYEDEESVKHKLEEMHFFYGDIDCIGYEISEELDKMLIATKEKIASAISEDGESIKMLEHIKEVINSSNYKYKSYEQRNQYKDYLKSREKQRASLINSN